MQNVPGPQPLQSNNFFHKITIVNIIMFADFWTSY